MAKKVAFNVTYSKVEDYKTALNSFIDLFNDLITNKDDCIKFNKDQCTFDEVSEYLLEHFGRSGKSNKPAYYDKKLGSIRYVFSPGYHDLSYNNSYIEIYPDDENQHAFVDYNIGTDGTVEISVSFSSAFDKSLFSINYMKKYITKIWASNDFTEFMNNLVSRHNMQLTSIIIR